MVWNKKVFRLTPEYKAHKAVCDYINLQYPKVVFFSDESGVDKSEVLAKLMKPLRSDIGIPDLFVSVAKGKYHGLYIEMKAPGEKIYKKDGKTLKTKHLEEQAAMHKRLREAGYFCDFKIGFDSGKECVDWYMKLKQTFNLVGVRFERWQQIINKMKYYIQNTNQGYLGNAIVFWKLGRSGYTAKLEDAEKFSYEEAKSICNGNPEKNKAWGVDYIDNNKGTARVTDSQYLEDSNIITFGK